MRFKKSKRYSLGIELELQIIDPKSYHLLENAKQIVETIKKDKSYTGAIKPEVGRSMIEYNSSVHSNISSLQVELSAVKAMLLKKAQQLNVLFAGGGVHPLQHWQETKIYPNERFQRLYKLYEYLVMQYRIFGLHVHIGCLSGQEALYLTHALARYVPHLIALSASSPIYEGYETAFQSVRANFINVLPSGTVIPIIKTWREFTYFFKKMQSLKLVKTMKDFYWDIRPKPEFGTVEIRICDSPLTMEKAVILTAYIQTLACFILEEKRRKIPNHYYTLYRYNRFQAARFGFNGRFINPFNEESLSVKEDILQTIADIHPFAAALGNEKYIKQIASLTKRKMNDATHLRTVYHKTNSLQSVIREQIKLWKES